MTGNARGISTRAFLSQTPNRRNLEPLSLSQRGRHGGQASVDLEIAMDEDLIGRRPKRFLTSWPCVRGTARTLSREGDPTHAARPRVGHLRRYSAAAISPAVATGRPASARSTVRAAAH